MSVVTRQPEFVPFQEEPMQTIEQTILAEPIPNDLAALAGSLIPAEPDGHATHNPTLYSNYETIRAMNNFNAMSLQIGAGMGKYALDVMNAFGVPRALTRDSNRLMTAVGSMAERSARDYKDPGFNIEPMMVEGRKLTLTEVIVPGQDHDFEQLIEFQRQFEGETGPEEEPDDPVVLVLSPRSGHYGSLIRATIEELSKHHKVLAVVGKNARDVDVSKDSGGMENCIDLCEGYIKVLGPDVNIVAICQATIPAMAAVVHLAQMEQRRVVGSVSLIAGPNDTRESPTAINKLASDETHNMQWFRDNVMAEVPKGYAGAGRVVFPSFAQIGGFIAQHPEKHINSLTQLFRDKANGNHAGADKTEKFYDDYLAGCDIDGKLYEDMIRSTFKDQWLAKNMMFHHGIKLDPSSIADIPFAAYEGKIDDICGWNQTWAALRLLTGLKSSMKKAVRVEDANHYSMFSGKLFVREVSPAIGWFVRDSAAKRGRVFAPAPADKAGKVIEDWHED